MNKNIHYFFLLIFKLLPLQSKALPPWDILARKFVNLNQFESHRFLFKLNLKIPNESLPKDTSPVNGEISVLTPNQVLVFLKLPNDDRPFLHIHLTDQKILINGVSKGTPHTFSLLPIRAPFVLIRFFNSGSADYILSRQQGLLHYRFLIGNEIFIWVRESDMKVTRVRTSKECDWKFLEPQTQNPHYLSAKGIIQTPKHVFDFELTNFEKIDSLEKKRLFAEGLQNTPIGEQNRESFQIWEEWAERCLLVPTQNI